MAKIKWLKEGDNNTIFSIRLQVVTKRTTGSHTFLGMVKLTMIMIKSWRPSFLISKIYLANMLRLVWTLIGRISIHYLLWIFMPSITLSPLMKSNLRSLVLVLIKPLVQIDSPLASYNIFRMSFAIIYFLYSSNSMIQTWICLGLVMLFFGSHPYERICIFTYWILIK